MNADFLFLFSGESLQSGIFTKEGLIAIAAFECVTFRGKNFCFAGTH